MAGQYWGYAPLLTALGILIYPWGLLMMFNQVSLQNYFSTSFLSVELLELIGVLFQVLGAVLIAVGTARVISRMVSDKLQEERPILLAGLASRINERISVEAARLATNPNQQPLQPRNCRYCGAQMRIGDTFCEECGKAQK